MHYNTLFQDRNLKNFLGRGTAPSQTPPHWRGRNSSPWQTPRHPLGAYGASIVAPSALHTSCFRRSVLCVPYFQCRFLATLTVTNVVQGKRSQWWKFTGPPNQKSWLRQCLLWHCLPDISVAIHHNRFFQATVTTHNWLSLEPPTMYTVCLKKCHWCQML